MRAESTFVEETKNRFLESSLVIEFLHSHGLVAIPDWHWRAVMDWSLSDTLEASREVETYDSAKRRHNKSEIINSN